MHPAHPEAPITNAFAMELLVFLGCLPTSSSCRLSLSVEKPNGVQHLAEMTNEFVAEQSEQIIGHGYERFVTYLTTLFLFILMANLMGLIPGLESPTANVVVPLGFAIVTFPLLPLPRHSGEPRSRISSSSWGRCGGLSWLLLADRESSRTSRACCR